jgi:hypothetical protein
MVVPEVAGVTAKLTPEQVAAVMELITGCGLTVTVTVNELPAQEEADGIT